jgi:hypothetical protein
MTSVTSHAVHVGNVVIHDKGIPYVHGVNGNGITGTPCRLHLPHRRRAIILVADSASKQQEHGKKVCNRNPFHLIQQLLFVKIIIFGETKRLSDKKKFKQRLFFKSWLKTTCLPCHTF